MLVAKPIEIILWRLHKKPIYLYKIKEIYIKHR